MTKANHHLRIAEDGGARFRPQSEFNAGHICSVTVIAFPCPTAADVREHAAHVRALRAQVFKPPLVCVSAFEPHLCKPQPPTPPTPVLPVIVEPLSAVPGRVSVRRVLEATADHFGTTV